VIDGFAMRAIPDACSSSNQGEAIQRASIGKAFVAIATISAGRSLATR
jgi:hypothetical protein